MKIPSSYNMQFSDDGDLVYFNINVKELFGINLSHPGIWNALRTSLEESRRVVPIRTGLMRKSYSMQRMNEETVKLFFDPQKILGQVRLGRMIKVYYPQYLKEHAKTFNWLDIVMRRFLNTLIGEIRSINKNKEKEDKIEILQFLMFYEIFKKQLKDKIKKEEGRENNDK